MKFKKILMSFSVMLLVFFVTAPVLARAEHGYPGPSKNWKVLVLVLPDASINYGGSKEVSTMQYAEIEKVRKMATDMKSWTTPALGIKVDFKIDYEDITSQSFGMAFGHSLEPRNIQSQINRNSTKGQYDSILVVYRSTNEQGYEVIAPTQRWMPRSEEANGATFATLPLKDADHKMQKFDCIKPEQYLFTQLLESVYSEMKPTCPKLNEVPMYSNIGQNAYELKSYMMLSKETNMCNYWDKFLK